MSKASSEQTTLTGTDPTKVEWRHTPWPKLEQYVFKLQKRIFKAAQLGDGKTVRQLQKTLLRSRSAKTIAVRQVSQDNRGRNTAGVDGIKTLTPAQRLEVVDQLRLTGQAAPTRRVWIPKAGTTEKRPLGIPTLTDRAMQAWVKQALEPEWEARFEPNSYGFRPGRSAHDAIEAIWGAINKKAKYVLDADIAKCFDRIDHAALLGKLNTFPTLRRQVKSWLKAGLMEGGQLFPTAEGTPQGGVISPLLANVALHGMETAIHQAFAHGTRKVGDIRKWVSKVQLIRYADDFVIIHEDRTTVEAASLLITDWLAPMGLELKASKTRLTHTLNEVEGKVGFDFLGFTVRQFQAGKHRTGVWKKGFPLGFKTYVTPSKTGIKRHYDQLAKIVDAHKCKPQSELIDALNPVIRGWSNYYSRVCSKRTLTRLGHLLYQKLRAWARRRHPNKTEGWTTHRYWFIRKGKGWWFMSRQNKQTVRMVRHADTPIVRHIKVQDCRSPFDGDWAYWGSRLGRYKDLGLSKATLLKRQRGRCTHCNLLFRYGDKIETDHIIPLHKGGHSGYDNLQLLHRHCHHIKTASDHRNVVESVAA